MNITEETILLLSCRLGQTVQPLSPGEYLPLFSVPVEELERLGGARAAALLRRRAVLERYLAAMPDVKPVTCLSQNFPKRLGRLGTACPPVLFCRGDVSLLNTPAVALVGSRRLLPRGYSFACRIGRLAAEEGYTLVSGGAVGADSVAQRACLEAGGRVIVFLPDALSLHPAEKNLLFCSAEGYDTAFSSVRALTRNHYIHALAETTFVAQCPKPQGGTWAGAVHNLKHGLSTLYALDDGTEGFAALTALGAIPVEDTIHRLPPPEEKQLSIFDEI